MHVCKLVGRSAISAQQANGYLEVSVATERRRIRGMPGLRDQGVRGDSQDAPAGALLPRLPAQAPPLARSRRRLPRRIGRRRPDAVAVVRKIPARIRQDFVKNWQKLARSFPAKQVLPFSEFQRVKPM